ncbi:unannotated protein [freshwater metagenome]|uniref:Unannotated protein n=1 Tax=freshwater metagenome TaxID=449393 RepID=A0A6J5ZK81_9ZZZZ
MTSVPNAVPLIARVGCVVIATSTGDPADSSMSSLVIPVTPEPE